MKARYGALLAWLLCCLLLHVVVSSPSSSIAPDSFTPCFPRECGPMPMLVLQCPDGTAAGYTCQRNTTTGMCRLVSPHCPPHTTHANHSTNDTSTHQSHHHTIHHGPTPVASLPYNASAHHTTPHTSYYTSPHPVFNCSRRQCGASIMPIVRTCPDGSHAYPLCAWVTERRRCGFLDPSCSFPGWRSDGPSDNESAAAESLFADDDAMSADGGEPAARQLCERGGCVLPMYVRMCPDGSTVRPHCVWSTVNGSSLCLASQPKCPTEVADEASDRRVVGENGGMVWGASLAVVGLTALLALAAA